ncbi:MAG: ribose 5-phosphate isomerase A [Deltaproteobacteria bacterium]|nr:ribose 5-phosphate isomerase A [Deltaproteobacteria bacterium]
MEDPREALKKAAALRAVEAAKSGMVLGLGTGSTVCYAIDRIGELLRAGKLTHIVGIATSKRTAEQARVLGIPLVTLATHRHVDLAIDGADEVDPALDLIKGMGGALLREKEVEQRAARFIVVVDHTKLVDKLGTKSPLPVEIARGAAARVADHLRALGCVPTLRGGAHAPFVTDNGNHILDCRFPSGIENAAALARALDTASDVLAHGLFLGMATEVVVAAPEGVRVLTRV